MTPIMSPRYDADQIGVQIHGTPKHCDILVVSGTLTERSKRAVASLWSQMPSPKAVVALGSCPASGNVFAESPLVLGASLDTVIPVDVWVPGCPPRPQQILDGIARAAHLLGEGATRDQIAMRAEAADADARAERRAS
jgi:Ni,Fe-hydrogenase III small subunit